MYLGPKSKGTLHDLKAKRLIRSIDCPMRTLTNYGSTNRSAVNDFRKFIKRLSKYTQTRPSKDRIRKVAIEAIKVIVRRTRLGYGVRLNSGTRHKLKPIYKRKTKAYFLHSYLLNETTPE